MNQKLLTKTPVVCLLTLVCCFLWGSAFPTVKIGYQMFSIASSDTAGQILFAGLRFFLAGVLVILFGSIASRKFLSPRRSSLLPIGLLALAQTVVQYFFFYIGLANTTGVKSSIINASSTFFAILMASLIFRYEKFTRQKFFGCIAGFAGVILINLAGGSFDFHMKINGEGFILIAALSYALSSVLVKKFSVAENPVMLSGWQFMLGGLVLAAAGFLMGGRFTGFSPQSILLLLYMAMISAVAYSLWGILLKYNPVSRIAVFGFMNPVFGVILSALWLGENNQAFTLYGLAALALVSCGIFLVNRNPSSPASRR